MYKDLLRTCTSSKDTQNLVIRCCGFAEKMHTYSASAKPFFCLFPLFLGDVIVAFAFIVCLSYIVIFTTRCDDADILLACRNIRKLQ